MPLLVGAVDLQRGQALQVFQKRAAQIGVGAPVLAHHALGDLLNSHDGDGDKRHAHQQRHGCGQAQRRQAREQGHRRQHRIEQLRQILAEIAFQLLAAFDADLHRFAGGDMLGIRRPHAHQLVVHLATHGELRRHGRGQAHALRRRQARHAHHDCRHAGTPQRQKPLA